MSKLCSIRRCKRPARILAAALFFIVGSSYANTGSCPESVSEDQWVKMLIGNQQAQTGFLRTLSACLRNDAKTQALVDGWAVASVAALDRLPSEAKVRAANFLRNALAVNGHAGYVPSLHNYAALFDFPSGSSLAVFFPRSQETFGRITKTAASQGEPRSLFNLATRMVAGDPLAGIEKDLDTAYQALVFLVDDLSNKDQWQELRRLAVEAKSKIERDIGESEAKKLSLTARGFNSMLFSQDIQNAMSGLENSYISKLDRVTLNRLCLSGMARKNTTHPIDGCLSEIVGTLDARSVYFDPDRRRELLTKPNEGVKPPVIRQEKLFDGKVIYLGVHQFLGDGAKNFLNYLGESESHEALRGLIVDLRNSSGGVLHSVIDVASLFLPEGALIGYAQSFRDGNKMETFFAAQKKGAHKDVLKTLPIVVLVNERTSAGAEFFAAALRENGRALTVGGRTAKRGFLQVMLPFAKDRGLRLTTGTWLTPRGRSIEVHGVDVDVEIAPGDPGSRLEELENDAAIQHAWGLLTKANFR